MNTEVAVLTTNNVQREVATLLEKMGIGCIGVDESNTKSIKDVLCHCKKIVLPFPSTIENLNSISNDEICEHFTPEHTVIGGMLKGNVKEELKKAEIRFFDYFENEAYVLKNAYLTSQGALRLLLESTNDFLVGKRVLVSGFGRIGKSLALMLKGLGMKVFVAVRREESAVEAQALGFETFNFNSVKGTLFYYDYIFNTVPNLIFKYRDVSHIGDDAVYFELASSPFGAEKKDFELLGKNYVQGGALPGRYYPKAVARNIVDFILGTGR